jgi:hypothetical protein
VNALRTLAITIGFALTLLGAPAQPSPTISGTLVDADCKADDVAAACPLTPATQAFGVQTPEGKFMKFDNGGNNRALVAVKRFLRRKGDIDIDRAGPIKASVTGSINGDTLHVDALELY